jgi:drug/metabolite transporter (DMT)-like permease
MCLESVFAALGGWLLLGQTLIPKELFGCALMLAGCIVAQLPSRRRELA